MTTKEREIISEAKNVVDIFYRGDFVNLPYAIKTLSDRINEFESDRNNQNQDGEPEAAE